MQKKLKNSFPGLASSFHLLQLTTLKAMYGQKPVMPIEDTIPTWNVLPWQDGLSREELLTLRIRQLERRPEDVEAAKERLKNARLKNKDYFDKRHRLRSKAIGKGDWVLVYDSSLDNQHTVMRKFSKRWFGPYVVKNVHEIATYSLSKLDGTEMKTPIAGKRIKVFKRREDSGSKDVKEEEETCETQSEDKALDNEGDDLQGD